jgi:3-hydroxymyristoyl/3-hydroxydecanoyl-(acyl carrier protein) dehydratase
MMISEFDVPHDCWFYRESSNPGHMPYAVVMEIALQTSGFFSAYLNAPHKMKTNDPMFRNLDATAEYVKPEIDFRGRVIVNKTKATNCSMLGDMMIHRFHFELYVVKDTNNDFADESNLELFYIGDTSFGWFMPEVFAKQTGLDSGKKTEPLYVDEKWDVELIQKYDDLFIANGNMGNSSEPGKLPRSDIDAALSLAYRQNRAQLVDELHLSPNLGKHKKGYAHGHKSVDKNDWFFSCHFWMDSVMPGSLGVEALFQCLESWVLKYEFTEEKRGKELFT